MATTTLSNELSRRLRTTVSVLLFASFAIVGCDLNKKGNEPSVAAGAQLSQETCRQADAALLAAQDELMIDFETLGQVVVQKAEWRKLRVQTQDQIVQAVAVKAACAAVTLPLEQSVTIKDGLGQVQAERVVPIAEAWQIDDLEI